MKYITITAEIAASDELLTTAEEYYATDGDNGRQMSWSNCLAQAVQDLLGHTGIMVVDAED